MDASEVMKRIRVRESIEFQCKSFVEQKIERYLEIEHQGGTLWTTSPKCPLRTEKPL